MPTAQVRKGYPRVTVSDDGSSVKEIEIVCQGFASEEAVVTYLDANGYAIGGATQTWRTDSISVHPSPLSLPNTTLGETSSPGVFYARVTQSLRNLGAVLTSSTNRLRGDKQLVQAGQIRMASVMGEWPDTLPSDPWIGNSETIECEIATGERLDISGKPQREAVGQVAITITELREGDWSNFDMTDQVAAQGTRCGSTCFGYDADTVLFQSVSVQQVKHSLARWTYKFLHDSKNFLDQVPFSMPLTNSPVPVNETTEIIAQDGDTPAILNHHFLAVWSSPYRVGDWTPTSLDLDDTYYASLIVGATGP